MDGQLYEKPVIHPIAEDAGRFEWLDECLALLSPTEDRTSLIVSKRKLTYRE
jgi:hypothetical protein